MTTLSPAITYALSVIVGILLFFLVFGAVFAGIWSLLVLFVALYGVAGAFAVSLGRVQAGSAALALIAPGLPWALWLFAASMREAGLLRASLWLAAIAVIFALAWVGGALAARVATRRD